MLLRLSTSFLLCLCGATLVQGSDNAALQGRVLDQSGAGVPDAIVMLHEAAGTVVFSVHSDEQGSFWLGTIAPGEYLVDAMAKGLTSDRVRTVVLRVGDTQALVLPMTVSGVLAQVSVTAAGVPQSVDEISKALDTVSVRGAEQRGLFLLSDALRFVPGLQVTTHGGPGGYTQIQTRGLPYQDTAILLDGSPLRDPTSPQDEASDFLNQLLLVAPSRVEILRGSGSSLYGTNAVGGTVNILSGGGGGGPLHGDVDVQGGGLGLFEGVARVGGGLLSDRLTYSLGLADLNESRGVDGVGATREWTGQGGAQYAVSPQIHAAADVMGATGYTAVSVTPSALSAASGVLPAVPVAASQLGLADANLPYAAGAATFLPSLGDPDSGAYTHFVDALFRLDQAVTPRLSYRVAYSLLQNDRQYTDGPAGPLTPNYFPPTYNTSVIYNGHVDTLNARLNYLVNSNQTLSAGYEFAREQYRELATDQNPDPTNRVNNRTVASQRFQSGYAQDQIRLLHDRLEILLSGRYTGVSLNEPRFVGGVSPYLPSQLQSPPSAKTGDASLAYFVPKTATKWRAHVGNSFRMPSVYERFGGYFYGGSFYGLGQPGLSPERAISVDGGVDQYLFGERVQVSATYFYAHLQQVISSRDAYPFDYYNTGGGIARGAELSTEIRPVRHTFVSASYTYTSAQDRRSQYYTGIGVDPLQTPRIMAHQVKIVATEELGKHIDVALDFDGGSSYLFPLYGNAFVPTPFRFAGPKQLGVSGGYTVPFREHFSVRFYTRVSNTLGQDYYQDGFRTPGRWAVGGMRLVF